MAIATAKSTVDTAANFGFESKLWLTADMLGHVYERLLRQFASTKGKNDGPFCTPRCAVRVLVEMLAPYKG